MSLADASLLRPGGYGQDSNWAADFGFPLVRHQSALDDDVQSVRSDFSVRTAVVAQHSQGQPQDTGTLKVALKEFIQEMVRGRLLHLQPKNGGPLRPLPCRISPDVASVVVGDQGAQSVRLADVLQIHRGMEAVALNLGFPLDTNMVVFELLGGACVTFHLGHPKAADDFTLFMRLLTSMQRQRGQRRNQGHISIGAGDNDDARSECSVQTATCQQQLSSTPMKSACSDPKEVKRMFKMFTETMRRGRDFYVMRQDGNMYDVECALSQGHDEFRMRWDAQSRAIPLREMLHIRTCQEAAKLQLGFPVDERCATVELQTGECITFKFGHVEACERFILCMRILVEQKRLQFASKGFGAAPGKDARPAATPSRSGAGVSAPPPAAKGPVDARAAVAAFVREMVAGCKLNVVGPTGLAVVQCSMDADLKAFKFTAHDGSCREVHLNTVRAVYVGAEAAKLGLDGIAVDELCATMELESGDCLTFKFPDPAQLDRFAVCMRVFVTASRQ